MSKVRLTREEQRALDAALEDLARLEASGPMSPADRGLADRFRSDDYAKRFALVLLALCPVDGYGLFVDIFAAWHHAMEAPSIPAAYARPLEDFARAKAYADYLIALNQSGRVEVGGPETIDNLGQAQRSLQWLRGMYERCEQHVAVELEGLPITRKSKDKNADLGVFSYLMRGIMTKNYGQPFENEIADLATIVFERDVSVPQVQRAARSRKVIVDGGMAARDDGACQGSKTGKTGFRLPTKCDLRRACQCRQ
jgi:hypothetical protein